jgi:hypothetical protein
MGLLIGLKPVWLLKGLSKGMKLTMKTHLIRSQGGDYTFGVVSCCFLWMAPSTVRCEERVLA